MSGKITIADRNAKFLEFYERTQKTEEWASLKPHKKVKYLQNQFNQESNIKAFYHNNPGVIDGSESSGLTETVIYIGFNNLTSFIFASTRINHISEACPIEHLVIISPCEAMIGNEDEKLLFKHIQTVPHWSLLLSCISLKNTWFPILVKR